MFTLLNITENSTFLTIDDLAKRWEKSSAWIYHNWRAIGLTPIRLGQALRFELGDVMDIERQNAVLGESFGALFESSSETILSVDPSIQRAINGQMKK
jgi:hypothetical protein